MREKVKTTRMCEGAILEKSKTDGMHESVKF